jgi:hypothetical protein
MKSIFFLAEQQLKKWENEGKSLRGIKTELASNLEEREYISKPLPGDYSSAVSRLHGDFNQVYYSRAPIKQLDSVLELPTENLAGEPMPEAHKLAERQMRWGAIALIAKAFEMTKHNGRDVPYKSIKQKLKKMYEICIPQNKLDWRMITESLKRTGYMRLFNSSQDAKAAMSIFNDVLFLAYGYGEDTKLESFTQSPNELLATGYSNQPMNEVLRIEESKIQRERSHRKFL